MRHNGRAPIPVSTVRPEDLNLSGETRMMRCPDCHCWRRLKRSMITPHRAVDAVRVTEPRRYYGDKPAGGRRCPGSAQRVIFDITPEQWLDRQLIADSTVVGRRPKRVARQLRPIVAPAVTQMTPTSAGTALTAYREHLRACRRSTTPGQCRGAHRCAEGARLAALYERLTRTQPCPRAQARAARRDACFPLSAGQAGSARRC